MDQKPNLSKNFNEKLFGEIKRELFLKDILSITVASFVKVFVSIFELFSKPSAPDNKDSKKLDV